MASKSGGVVPPEQAIVDANQAVAILSTLHHWNCTKCNSDGESPRYSLTVTHAGKRVRVSRRTFVLATIAALAELRGKDVPKMRLVGT